MCVDWSDASGTIEIDRRSLEFATNNVSLNGFDQRIQVTQVPANGPVFPESISR